MSNKAPRLTILFVLLASLFIGCGGVDEPDDVDSVKDYLENPDYQDEDAAAKKKKT